jgi:hypothetical protein
MFLAFYSNSLYLPIVDAGVTTLDDSDGIRRMVLRLHRRDPRRFRALNMNATID